MSQINEATKQKTPSSLYGYRKWLASLCKKAGAPSGFTDEIDDIDYEGSGVAGAIIDAWQEISYELSRMKKMSHGGKISQHRGSPEREMNDIVLDSVHDAILNASDEYRNSWNYEPGHKTVAFNGNSLAKRVEALADGVGIKNKKMPQYEKSGPELMNAKTFGKALMLILKFKQFSVKKMNAPQTDDFTFSISSNDKTCRDAVKIINELLTDMSNFNIPSYAMKFKKVSSSGWRGAAAGTKSELVVALDQFGEGPIPKGPCKNVRVDVFTEMPYR